MSDLQEKTAKLIAEAKALLEKAQRSRERAAGVFRMQGVDPGRVDEQLERLPPKARAVYEKELQQQLASLDEAGAPVTPVESAAASRPHRPRKPRSMI